jgi:predicted dehydrogenase/nucleoside-diphosphate-sugar epimerase
MVAGRTIVNRERVRVGLVGAGYIASWHADALAATRGVDLVAVCDPALSAATALAKAHGATAFASLAEMLAVGACDAVHILAPPHLHKDLALESHAAGAHVLVEKPFALSRADCLEMVAAAAAADRVIAANHNFLGLPSYRRLKRSIADGAIGRTDSAEASWRFPLTPVRSGPFGLWMLRAPQNLLLELGPHLFAFAIDLFGPLEDLELRVAKPIEVPGGVTHFQSWRVLARAGHVDVSLALSLVEGVDDRTLSLRGVSGAARLDFANDVLLLDRPNAADIVLNPLLRGLSQAGQHLREGTGNAMRQLGSLNRKSPYALGFQGAIAAFYRAIREGAPIERSFSGAAAAEVIEAIEQTLRQLPAPASAPASTPFPGVPTPPPSVLVTGGTGFIGRSLTRALVASGRSVRVLSRGRANPFADLGGRVEIVPVSLKDPDGLRAAMAGVDAVFHLARAEEATWEGYLEHDVAVAEAVAEAVLAAGVRLLVYTGTIASYDASRPNRPITEATDFGRDMQRRNLYARSKALCEARLMAMHRSRGLPIVVARPGIVVGADGPLQHWGIGRWHGAGAVRIWGDGRNVIPLVLVDDLADGLIRILEAADVTGQSFNLVGEPLMSAQDYFAAIEERTNTRIRVVNGSLTAFYLADLAKYLLKRHVLGRTDLVAPSLVDWKSRAHLSPFRNDHAKRVLGWRPASSRQDFVDRAIDGKLLFGF